MSSRQTVALIGDSILLAGMAIGLCQRPDLQVERVDPECEGIDDRLDRIRPDLVVTEMSSPWAAHLLTYLVAQPNLRFAGIDVANGHLLMLSSRHIPLTSMEELIRTVTGPELHTVP